MKITALILLLLLFIQSYLFYNLLKKHTALDNKYEEAILATESRKKINLDMANQVQEAKNKNLDMHARLTEEKISNTELRAKNDKLKQTINELEQKNISQANFIQQKDNEILIYKKELLDNRSE